MRDARLGILIFVVLIGIAGVTGGRGVVVRVTIVEDRDGGVMHIVPLCSLAGIG